MACHDNNSARLADICILAGVEKMLLELRDCSMNGRQKRRLRSKPRRCKEVVSQVPMDSVSTSTTLVFATSSILDLSHRRLPPNEVYWMTSNPRLIPSVYLRTRLPLFDTEISAIKPPGTTRSQRNDHRVLRCETQYLLRSLHHATVLRSASV